MKTASEMTNQFLKRFHDLHDYLKTEKDIIIQNFKTSDPVSHEEIEEVEQKLKMKLPEDFLAYFKESNGYELQYKFKAFESEEEGYFKQYFLGAIRIPSLKEIMDYKISCDSEPGDYDIETLGGHDDYELRQNMYCFDRFNEWHDSGRYTAVYYHSKENLLLISKSYDACITDSHPITVASYFELCLATAGLTTRLHMLSRGSDGNYKIIDFSQKNYEALYPWSKTLTCARKKIVSPEFYELTSQATEAYGYDFRYMKVENSLLC